ncbi:hypothetical protein JXI42_09495 [bacterium]|nr:hypothetical protein [bacterium]
MASSLSQQAEQGRSQSGVSFLLTYPDAVGFSMGGAGLAFGNEAYTAFYNPGAMVLHKNRFNFGNTYSKWLPKSSGNSQEYSVFANYDFGPRSKLGRIGFGYLNSHVEDELWLDSDELLLGYFDKKEYLLMLSYAHPIIQNENHILGFGTSMKYIFGKDK